MSGNLVVVFCVAGPAGVAEISSWAIRAELTAAVEKSGAEGPRTNVVYAHTLVCAQGRESTELIIAAHSNPKAASDSATVVRANLRSFT